MSPTRRRLVALGAALVLVTGACGSGDDGGIFATKPTEPLSQSTVVQTTAPPLTVASTSTTTTASTSTTTSTTTTSTTTTSTTTSTTTTTTLPPPPEGLDPNAAATFGSFDLESGFVPDPFTVDVVSGGPFDVAYLGGACVGFAAGPPDVSVTWDGGGDLLRFYFLAEVADDDTALVVSGPAGAWSCNDDSFGTLDPTLDFAAAAAGRYDIWIASLAGNPNGVLAVTELQGSSPVSDADLDVNAPPSFGVFDIDPGFSPDPIPIDVVSGGPIDVSHLGPDCVGFAAVPPDVSVNLSAFTSLLRFYFIPAVGGDAALVINNPAGEWVCNDDSFGTLNPTIDFKTGGFAGRYDIWVASVSFDENVAGTLFITEAEANHPS